MDCQLQCQSRGYAECKSRLTGGCKAQCAKPDRVLLFDILRREIGRAQRSAGYRFAVLFLDLDGFKAVNDTLGHEAGDRVLVTVSERLRACLRPMDAVARLGGDEFAVVVADVKDEAEANGVALRIRAALSTPQKLADGEHVIGASIGVVLSDARCTDPSAVLREADLAMYEEKSLQHAVRQGRALS
jgi:diguanylate cyclase (GGDEF)-like protein